MNNQKFVQYTLWTDCNNNCAFCLHKNNKVDDKVSNLEFLIPHIKEDNEYNTIGFIGGEFFNKQLNDDRVKILFYKAVDLVLDKIANSQVIRFYVAATLIQKNLADLFEFLNYAKARNALDKIVLCTSYDTLYRFHTDAAKSLWIKNIKEIHKAYPEVKIHVDIILTEAFMQSVINNEFSITDFCNELDIDLDFEEPKTGIDTFKNKLCSLADFFPKRSTFLKFLKKTVLEDETVDAQRLLNRNLMSNKLYIPNNGKFFIITDRNTSTVYRDFDTISNKKYATQIGYIDSDIPMYNDVELFR